MKITFTTDDGAELTLRSDTLKLANTTDKKNIALAYELAGTLVPLIVFNGQIAQPATTPATGALEQEVKPPTQ